MPAVKDQIVDGFEGLEQVILEMVDRAAQADFTDTLDGFVPDLERTHQDHFQNRSSPDGNAWEPTHWFRPANNDHNTLEDRGVLRGSLIRGAQGNITEIVDNQLEFGTEVDYAGIHQFGATIIIGIGLVTRGGKGGYLPAGTQIVIPPRPFVGMTESRVDLFTEAAADDLVNIIRN